MKALGMLKTITAVFLRVKSPLRYLLNYTSDKRFVYRMRNGISFISDTRLDRYFFHEVWIHQVYTKRFGIGPDDIVVDIGAQKGIFVVFAALKAKHVYAFEPVDVNYSTLLQNVKRNRLRNVTAYKKAVCPKSGRVDIFLDDTNSGGHSTVKSSGNHIVALATTLKRFMAEARLDRIDFLKMDCEGAEYGIIASLDRKTLLKIDRIAMEHHRVAGRSVQDIVKKLGKDFDVFYTGDMLYAIRVPKRNPQRPKRRTRTSHQ